MDHTKHYLTSSSQNTYHTALAELSLFGSLLLIFKDCSILIVVWHPEINKNSSDSESEIK